LARLNIAVNRRSLGRFGWITPGLAVLIGMSLLSAGCETKSFFDPTEMGRYSKKPIPVPILKTLDTGYEEEDPRYATATDVRPSDLVAVSQDYVIGRNDLIQVSITDLVAPGVESVKVSRVSESGFISLPLVGQVQAAGLTEAQLEAAIVQRYRDANLIQQAQVSVVTLEARSRTFTITGAVNRGGQYQILDSNFRLLDALALVGDVTSPVGIENIYIVRQKRHDIEPQTTVPAAPGEAAPATQPTQDLLTPRSQSPLDLSPKMMSQAPEQAGSEAQANQPATAAAPGSEGRIIIVDDKPMTIEGGQAVPAQAEAPAATEAAPAEPSTQGFEFNALQEPSDVRVIRVPYQPLQRGELKYNVVIRPQDLIIVQQPVIGEYYMGGHVARTGVYSLTARNITLKQAVIAAGMLDQLAIPSRTQIVRRIGPDREIFARVDLDKIFAGEQPDILLKPDDQIMVGTNALAPFLAAFRSGFRLTYGFGFIYDRNYWEQNRL